MLKIGDEVRLSEEGKNEYIDHVSNPHHLTGVLIPFEEDPEYDEDDYWAYRVRWSNGACNVYNENELVSVGKPRQPTKNGFKTFAAAKL